MSGSPNPSAPLLELRGVHKFFGRTVALHEITLAIQPGQRWAIFGRNGAGKTTLLRILSGLMRPSQGEVRYCGARLQEQKAFHRQIGFLSHATSLYGDLTAVENLDFYARLYRIGSPQPRIQQLLQQVGLEDRSREPIRRFSRGMQQRLAIARAFLHRPSILLFDEPYAGLDTPSVEILQKLIAQSEDITLLLSSHQLERGLALADHCAILHQGRLVAAQEVLSPDDSQAAAAYSRWVEGVYP